MFYEIEIFCLGAAAVIDTALLLMLLGRNNRRRLIVPLLIVVVGTWLYHTGSWGAALLRDNAATWPLLHGGLLLLSATGLLLMPSALLHGVLRAGLSGITHGVERDWRYGVLYLPLLVLLPMLARIAVVPEQPLLGVLADWVTPYVVWLMLTNTLAALGFLRLRGGLEEIWNQRFVTVAGVGLLILVLLHGAVFFVALPLWPQYHGTWHLIVALSPVPLVVLVSYFIVRFNFLQLVLERVFIYGALAAGAVLLHQVFLQDLWDVLSDRFRINFALVEGVALFALILLIRPLRERSAEALRYLMGRRVAELRRKIRQFVLDLSIQSGEPSTAILNWFVGQGPLALEAEFIGVWLLAADGGIGERRGATECLDDDQVRLLHAALKARERPACRPGDAPNVALGDQLLAAGAAAAIVLEHPVITGLVLFGRGGGDMHDERLNALIMVVEQLAITLHGSQLQAQRIMAERRALQSEKLSTLGLVAGSIAHEVKNPLSSIRTIATVMAEELDENSEHREDLRLMVAEVDRLSATVNRLLQFARPSPSRTDSASLGDVVESTLQVMRHVARQHHITLNADLSDGLPRLRVDETTLREVLFNLIGNSIEAIGNNGRVLLSARQTDVKVLITVADDGPGIPASIRDCLFQPFVSAKIEGTGLGLYLVGIRVREIGGEIACHSDSRGTTFKIGLPVTNT